MLDDLEVVEYEGAAVVYDKHGAFLVTKEGIENLY